jgi:hypothetical protein
MKKIGLSTGIIMILLIGVASFYWFQYRPSQIKKECATKSEDSKNIDVSGCQINNQESLFSTDSDPGLKFGGHPDSGCVNSAKDHYYSECLHKGGL